MDDNYDYDPCQMCGGPLLFLGTLGNRDHYQCRNCGIECSRLNPQAREEMNSPTPVNVNRPMR